MRALEGITRAGKRGHALEWFSDKLLATQLADVESQAMADPISNDKFPIFKALTKCVMSASPVNAAEVIDLHQGHSATTP